MGSFLDEVFGGGRFKTTRTGVLLRTLDIAFSQAASGRGGNLSETP